MTTPVQDENHQGDFFHFCFSNSVKWRREVINGGSGRELRGREVRRGEGAREMSELKQRFDVGIICFCGHDL